MSDLMSDQQKITINWDELRTRKVEQRLNAMDAVKRNRDYASMTDAPEPQTAQIKNLWYNTVVYMTIFGLVGGLLAWGCGTMLKFKPSAPGNLAITGTYKICICNDKICQPSTTPVTINVNVK